MIERLRPVVGGARESAPRGVFRPRLAALPSFEARRGARGASGHSRHTAAERTLKICARADLSGGVPPKIPPGAFGGAARSSPKAPVRSRAPREERFREPSKLPHKCLGIYSGMRYTWVMENRPTDDEHDQRLSDAWARRILACPRAACRRSERCMLGGEACPAVEADPFPEEHGDGMVRMVRRMIKERWEECEIGPEAKAAGNARRERDFARRHRLAFKRAREGMGMGKN